MNCDYIETYIVISEIIVSEICERLQIESYSLFKLKPLREYDDQLVKRSITYCLLSTLEVQGHKKESCSILIIQLRHHDLILGKPWMNKHEMIFDMRKDKVLFIFERCEYDNNKALAIEDLSFLPIISFVIITPLKSTVEDSDEKSSDVDSLKDTRKRSTPILRAFKEKMIQKLDLLDIAEIDISIYYHLARSKKNKLFSLTMNEIYDTLIEPPEILPSMKRDSRISINDSYSCNSKIKYKKCCESYISKNSQINNIKILTPQKVLSKFSIDYHNYADVFDRS